MKLKRALAMAIAAVLTTFSVSACGSKGGNAPAGGTAASNAANGQAAGQETPGQGAAEQEEPAAAQEGDVPSWENATIKIGATSVPHAEILEAVKPILAEQGIRLEIMEFQDYVLPNTAVEEGHLDANYFQHRPYLDSFNEEHGTHLVPIANVHYEPFGIFPGKTKSLDDLGDGAKVAVPNDTTNEARALLLLEDAGLIKVNPEKGLEATVSDITDNPKNLDIVELEAAQIPRALQDVDIAAINGNYAMEAGLNVGDDALFVEASESLAAATFANVIAVKAGNEGRPEFKALVDTVTGEEAKGFIRNKYGNAVIPSQN